LPGAGAGVPGFAAGGIAGGVVSINENATMRS